jgi:glycosyltransferase involved in cell wall biosynthesis
VRVVHTERPEDGPAVARRWGRTIDATVCVSPRIARRVPGAVFVPNPIPAGRLRGPRRELFPGSPRPALGFLGRLLPLKNVHWLIDHLPELGCDLALQALDTELETAAGLAARAAGRGVAGRVRFLPPGGDAGTLVRSVDALAVVSRHEGLPMAAIEAAAVGTPVIATRVGALAELFGDAVLFVDGAGGTPDGPGGRTDGIEGEPEGAGGVPDVDGLRRAVERVAGGKEAGRGEKLRALVEVLCDPAAVAAGYARAIEGALERVPRHRPSPAPGPECRPTSRPPGPA